MRQKLARTIGQTIARWRTSHEMTQEELSLALGVDPMTVSRFERGVTLPSLVTIQQIASVFGVTMARMLEDAPVASTDDTQVIASLMKNFTGDERAFVIDTLKRYRALTQRQRR